MQITIVFFKNIFPLQTLINKTPVLHKHSLDEKTLDTPELQQDDCWYFLPYIHPNDHRFSVVYTKKNVWGLHTHDFTLDSWGAYNSFQTPSCNCFWLHQKPMGPYFFSIIPWLVLPSTSLSPLLVGAKEIVSFCS